MAFRENLFKRFPGNTRTLVLVLLAFNVTIVLALALVGTWALETMSREEDREVVISTQLIEDVYRLNLAVDSEIMGIRGFMVTGSERARQSWANGKAAFAEARTRLEPQLDSADQEVWRRLLEAERHYVAYGERMLALKQAGRETEARRLFETDGRARRREIDGSLADLIAGKKRDVATIHHEVDRLERNVKTLLAWTVGVSIPVTFLLMAWLAWRVVMPLRRLAEAANQVAAGRLSARVAPGADDEFGRAMAAFNQMAARVEESHGRLTQANEELKALDKSKDEFLSVVSHELRTPLTVILGFTRLISGGVAGPVNDRQGQYLEKVVAAGDRMLAMVNDLLDFAKLQHGMLTLAPTEAAYDVVVAEIAATMKPLADQKGITVFTRCALSAPVWMDDGRIFQVLANLVGNALKFTPEGGAITVDVFERDGAVRTEVTDNGAGIPEADLPKLFQRFTQLDMSATRQAGGAGLGLSIAKALVEAHGGRIGVDSTPGVGSTFWFTLPARAETTVPSAAGAPVGA